jgi:sugar/nucleoside kinase (ribokinase family)
MSKRWDVATVGEIYIDHVFSGLPGWPRPGEEVFTKNYLCEVGGGAAITACALGLLGRKAAVFGVVGEEDAAWIAKRLGEHGVESSGLKRAAQRSGVTVSISVTEDRTFFSYAGTNELLTEYLLSEGVAEQLSQAAHVHFAVPLDRLVAVTLLPALQTEGCTVSLDVGWQPEWYRNAENLRTCKEIDYFLPNRKEAEYLTGKGHPEEVLAGLESLGFSHVVVKLGADGAAIRIDGKMLRVPSPEVSVVDTTGAGDAFDAGLIDAILDGADAVEMLRRASGCGALSTRMAGGLMGLPTREKLEEIYEQR